MLKTHLRAGLLIGAFFAAVGPVLPAHASHNPAGRTTTGKVGDALEYAVPAVVLGGTLAYRDWQGGRQFAYGAATTIAVTHALKSVIDKERPDGRDDKSFPSAHAAITMHSAAYLHERYGLALGAPAYLVAAWVAYSRVYDDRHDEQDVVAGAAIGFISARMFTTRYKNVEVTPVAFDGGAAIHVAVRF